MPRRRPLSDGVAALQKRLSRWRAAAIGATGIAAALAIGFIAREATRAVAPREFVAVLQKSADSPAFVASINLDSRRTDGAPVAAPPQAGKSYELWIIDAKLGAPRSLGVIDAAAVTRNPRLAAFDRAVVEDATYAVTVEPEGGSPERQAVRAAGLRRQTGAGRAMSARDPIPLHVVTGFLGAGKTSLINRLLNSAALADSLVIVNEWGEIGLDHLLFEAIEGEVISLNSGCLCCTLRGDLVDRLNDLIDRRDAGTIAPFARVILETTGLADPAPILLALAADPRLAARFRVAGVTTLVDAVNGEATLAAHGEAQRQAALADRIGLAKSDLVAADERSVRLAAARAALRALNPVAPILDVAAGELDADAFLAEPLALRRLDDAPPIAHAASVRSHVFVSEALIQPPALGRFLDLLSELLGPRLLRVKGLIGLADNPDRPLLIHGAQHVFHAPRVLTAWPDGERLSRLVVIADGVAPARIEALWAALTGAPRLDAPDLAALTDNPLAPKRAGLLA